MIGNSPANNGWKDAKSLFKLLTGANVKRYHTVLTIGEQNNGHHSLRVLLILRYLLDGNVSQNLMWATVFHDLPEHSTGDIPGHVKWDNQQLEELLDNMEHKYHLDNGTYIELTKDESILLNIADKLELVVYCAEQISLGNIRMKQIRDRGMTYVLDKAPEHLFDKVLCFSKQLMNGELDV